MLQGCTKMVLENVVIMGCCNEKLCSRSEYLGGRGERRKKGEQQRKRLPWVVLDC